MILDACCGSKMFWFNKSDERAVFSDNRIEQHVLKDRSNKIGYRLLVVNPDVKADFTALPYKGNSFPLVVFDPPHLIKNGSSGWLAKKYGKLGRDWQSDIRDGFKECFRVLRPEGTLIFKWNERDIPLAKILSLTPEKPLFGNTAKNLSTHWIVFIKPEQAKE